ncbi:hypothetical protein NL676_031313 [Syzygium grande]|nr:hypothetical protein NL676_031313 [Syzygium grande]
MGDLGSNTRLLRSDLVAKWCIAVLISVVLVGPITCAAKIRHFRWEVEYKFWSPDCVEGIVMSINGQFPGPTISAEVGDTISVKLTNKLSTEGVVIHWHGIRQLGTPWADGTASISQCPINPGETFTYRFKVDKVGTYFYHGHYGMQRAAGLYGSLIVLPGEGEKEPFHYNGEFNLLLSDWWHKSAREQEVGLSSVPFRWIGEPQSLLINGRGQYNCSLAASYSNSTSSAQCILGGGEQCAPFVLPVLPNKTYRLRLASTTALASLNVAIGGHKMVVVEADGNYVQPFAVDDLDIYSGESYSVLIHTDQDPRQNYWIAIGVRGRRPNTSQALTVLNYLPNSASKLRLAASDHPSLERLQPQQSEFNGQTKWSINNVSLSLPPTPYLGSIKHNILGAFDPRSPPASFPADYDVMRPPANPNSTVGSGIYTLKLHTTVDIILQNANALDANTSEIHPWHLHGHDFWVLGYGEGKFAPGDGDKRLNLKNPPLRNTAVIFPYGWTALRFVADNPGAWAFHCHIEPHLHMGMGVVLAEGVGAVRRMRMPGAAFACGLTAKMVANDGGRG